MRYDTTTSLSRALRPFRKVIDLCPPVPEFAGHAHLERWWISPRQVGPHRRDRPPSTLHAKKCV